jgi:pyruvate,orthophosphate dikinase
VPATDLDDPDIALLTEWARAQSPHGASGSLPELLRRREMEKIR